MKVRELLFLPNLPVYQNKMFGNSAAARACPRGDVQLSQDLKTGLVSNFVFDQGKIEYDQGYQNEQGHSDAFQSHLRDVLKIIDRHSASMKILEIGCGKGAFLDFLRENGHDAKGIDPAYEGNSPHITKARFEPGSDARGDVIVMRHVLEHIPNPISFLESIANANSGVGKIYIEVPCLDWILRRRAWFDIFYEHVNYFRAADFSAMFGSIFESGHLFGGQYIYVVADLGTLRLAPSPAPNSIVVMPSQFFATIERCVIESSARTRVVWGAGAKGVMFSHHMAARGIEIKFAIDVNPAKQGKFLASSGLQVLSPESALKMLDIGSDIFVMNSNYLDEIRGMAGPNFNFISVDRS